MPFGKSQITIVGVVENVKYTGIGNNAEGVLYRPFAQSPMRIVVLVAKTTGDPLRIASDVRSVIRSYDPSISVPSVQPLTTWVSDAVAQPRFRTLLLSSIAVITLVLAMIGLYGVIAYSTAQRTAEIGFESRSARNARTSCGWCSAKALASPSPASSSACRRLLGHAAAVDVSLRRQRRRTSTAFAGSAIALFFIALVATYVPARRAARIDPMQALRSE